MVQRLIGKCSFGSILIILFLSTSSSSQNDQLIRIVSPALRAVFLVPDGEATDIEIHFVVQAGEADHDYEEGLAHYVEHMVWLNIQKSSGKNYEHNSNAWTTLLATGYWLSGPTKDFTTMAVSLSKVLEPIELDSEFLLQERGIILSEYYLREGQNSKISIAENLTRILFQKNSLSRSLIGNPDIINHYQINDALSLHRRTHQSSNTIVLIYGNVTPSKVEETFQSIFGSKISSPTQFNLPTLSNLTQERIVETFNIPGITQPHLIYRKIIQLPKKFQQLEYSNAMVSLDLLRGILNSSLEGGLAKTLRYDGFIAKSFVLDLKLLGDQHLELSFNANPDRGVTLQHLLQAFETTLVRIASNGIPYSTFTRVKSRSLGNFRNAADHARITRNLALAAISDRQHPFDFNTAYQATTDIETDALKLLMGSIVSQGRTVAHLNYPIDTKEN